MNEEIKTCYLLFLNESNKISHWFDAAVGTRGMLDKIELAQNAYYRPISLLIKNKQPIYKAEQIIMDYIIDENTAQVREDIFHAQCDRYLY